MSGFRQEVIQPLELTNLNSLIQKQSSNKIKDIKPQSRNLELKFIVLELINVKIYQFLIADETASIYANFFDKNGEKINIGDIFYLNGGYASIYNNKLILYEGKQNILKKISKNIFIYNQSDNISIKQEWKIQT